jgi:protein transport protein SEC24
VDIFTTSAGYTDIATLGQLCTVTGGRLCYYPGFSNSSENDMYCMAQDIRYSLTCARAYEAVMKVRCSKGLVCDGIMGLGVEKSTSQREVSSITEDHTWHVLLNYNADLSEEASDAFLQISFLHTNLAQQRVVRVLNFAMPIVTSLSAVFRYADVHGVCNSILREAVAESGTFARAASGYFDYTLSDIRQKMSEHGVNILYAYRQHCASNHSSGQLILPESLKFLVVFLNSIARSDYLVSNKNQGVQVSADVRAVRFVALESMPISLCIPVVYPRMMTLLDMMSGNAGNLKARKYGAPICVLPKYRYPSGTHVSDDELILLDAGTSIFLWVGLDVPSEVLVDLFGVEELPDDAAMLHPIRITRRDNDLSNRVLNVIEDHLRRHRVPSCFSDVRIVKQGSAAEDHFFNLLVEDEGPNGEPSYCAALVTAHGIIQKKMQASEY